MLFILLLLVAQVSAQVDDSGVCKLSSCTLNADCQECYKPIVDGTIIQPHEVFIQPVFLEFFEEENRFVCISNLCQLNAPVVNQFTELVAQCNLVSRSQCFIPPDAPPTVVDIIAEVDCQQKRCALYSGYNRAGFCIYDFTGFAGFGETCCVNDVDCPIDLGNINSEPCDRAACIAEKCVAQGRQAPLCCTAEGFCSGVTYIPLPNDFNIPDQNAVTGICADVGDDFSGLCNAVIQPGTSCFADIDCGGDGVGNVCAIGECVGGQCQISPRPIQNAGCCTDDDDSAGGGAELCQTDNACLIYQGCSDTTQSINTFPISSVAVLPTFRCQYEDLRTRGCCVGNNECAELAEVSGCVSPVCNGATNRCVLNEEHPFDRAICAYSSADCQFQFLNGDFCDYFASRGNANPAQEQYFFRCELQTTGLCDPPDPMSSNPFPVPPPGGLVPELVIVETDVDCDYFCPGPDQNTLRVKYRITNTLQDDDDDYPLILYNFQLATFTDTTNRIVDDVVLLGGQFLNGNPPGNLYSPEFDTDKFNVGSISEGPTFVGYRVDRKFFMNDPDGVGIHPGVTLELEFEILFTPDQLVSVISAFLVIEPFEFCGDFYFGREPNCDDEDDYGSSIFRDEQFSLLSPLTQFGNGPNNCQPKCFAGVSTTTAPVTPAPTPVPVPTSAPTPVPPTPAPPSEMTSLAVNAFYTLSAALLSCSFNCSSQTDGMLNSIMLDFAQIADRGREDFFAVNAIAVDISLTRVGGGSPVLFRSIASPVGSHRDANIVGTDLKPIYIESSDPTALAPFGVNLTNALVFTTPFTDEFDVDDTMKKKLSFFYDAESAFDDYVSGEIVVTTFDTSYQCDATSVALGVCGAGELGNTITLVTELPPIELTFGSGEGECTQRCPLPAEAPAPVFCSSNVTPMCDYDCGDITQIVEQQNRYSAEVCVVHDEPVSGIGLPIFFRGFRLTIPDAFGFAILQQGAYFEFENGTRLPPDAIDPVDDIDYIWDIPSIRIDPGEDFCFRVSIALDSLRSPNEVYRDTVFAFFKSTVSQRCTAIDVQTGYCPLGPRSDGFDEIILAPQKTKVMEFSAEQEDGVCSENCQYVDIGEFDELGGFVFLDGNADGFFNVSAASEDEPLANRVVEVVASQVLINPPKVMTTTDASGVWRIDRNEANVIIGVNQTVFVRVLGGPANSVATIRPMFGNPNLANFFFDTPPFTGSGSNPIRSDKFVLPRLNDPWYMLNAGYRPLNVAPPTPPTGPECVPFVGPYETDARFRVESELVECDTCNSTQLGPAQDGGCRAQCDASQDGGLVFRRYAVHYRLVNDGTMAAEPAGILESTLHTVPENADNDDDDDTSLFVCAQPRFIEDSVITSGGAGAPTLLEQKQAQNNGPLWRPPRVSVAYAEHPPNGAATEFVIEFDVCQSRVPPIPPAEDFGELVPVNVTARVISDECLQKERQWFTCAIDHDMRRCRNELLFGGDEDASCTDDLCTLPPFGEPLPPGATLPPGVTLPPTPPPTPPIVGPPGANTQLQQFGNFLREDKFCVSDRRIDTFLCTNNAVAYDACLAAGLERTVVTSRAALLQPNGAIPSQPGTLTIELERLAPQSTTQFCRLGFDPQVNVSSVLLPSGFDVIFPATRQLAKVIDSDVVNGGTLAHIVVEFVSLNPGEAVLIELSELECPAAVAGQIQYRYSQRIQSATCINTALCTFEMNVGPTKATNASALQLANKCPPLHDSKKLPFASCRTPGVVAHEAHEDVILGAPMGATPPPSHPLAPGILALLIVGGVALCVVLIMCWVFVCARKRRVSARKCTPARRRRTVKV